MTDGLMRATEGELLNYILSPEGALDGLARAAYCDIVEDTGSHDMAPHALARDRFIAGVMWRHPGLATLPEWVQRRAVVEVNSAAPGLTLLPSGAVRHRRWDDECAEVLLIIPDPNGEERVQVGWHSTYRFWNGLAVCADGREAVVPDYFIRASTVLRCSSCGQRMDDDGCPGGCAHR